LAGGQDSLKKRINDADMHKQIIKEMLEMQNKYKYKSYNYAYVASHSADTTLNGKIFLR
jgi:hypothetical protein